MLPQSGIDPLLRPLTTFGVITLLLLVALPVSAAPSLEKSSQSSYKISIIFSPFQSCETLGINSSPTTVICPLTLPMPLALNISGTLGWSVTNLNSTTVSLNVTRDLALSTRGASIPSGPSLGSFGESIDLATRIIHLSPIGMPELDQVLQMAQTNWSSSTKGPNWSSYLSTVDQPIITRPLYTMWWVNGPLKLNQTVPVLGFPTNVTRSTNVDLGGALGTRPAWELSFSPQLLSLGSDSSTNFATIIPSEFESTFAFDYDQAGDLLLNASARINLGFENVLTYPPTECQPSPSMSCPASTNTQSIMRQFGFDLRASLALTGTTLDLTHRMLLPATPGGGNSGSQTGSNSGGGSGTASAGSSTNNQGTPSSYGTGGSGNGASQSSGSSGQPASQNAAPMTWIYALIGIFAAAVIAAGVWVARKRSASGNSKSGFSSTVTTRQSVEPFRQ